MKNFKREPNFFFVAEIKAQCDEIWRKECCCVITQTLGWSRCYRSGSGVLVFCFKMESLVYTGCPRRKGPNFGRGFLRSNYTDITQNTYIQSSMVTEILNIEK